MEICGLAIQRFLARKIATVRGAGGKARLASARDTDRAAGGTIAIRRSDA